MKSRIRPRRCRSSAMWPRPAASAPRTPVPVMSRPATRIRPAAGSRSPATASTSSDCPLPSTPARPTISPARTSSDRPRTAGRPRSSSTSRSSTESSGSPAPPSFLSSRKSTSRPTMRRARLASVAPSVETVSTFLPRRSTVTRSAISSTSRSLCEMKITDTPSRVSVRRILNSSAVSWAVRTAVGSSRMRMSAPRCRTRRISTRCCWPTPMSSTRARGSTLKPNVCDSSRTRRSAPSTSSSAPLRGSDGEHDVLRHRHDRDEHEVLVHHADPEPDRLARRADPDRLAAEADLALVGLVEPVEDVHERRLARPVLPEQGVHLALAQVEVDAVVRDQRAEALGDALELEGQGGGGVQGATARCRGCCSACPRRSASRAR